MTTIFIRAAAVVAAGFLGSAAAQDIGGPGIGTPPTQPTGVVQGGSAATTVAPHDAEDVEFLLEAIRTDLAEIRLGELAADRGRDPRVREYGMRLQEDHSRALEEKAALLRTYGFDVPAEASIESLQVRDALAMLPDGAFDREFAALMVAAHEEALEEYGAQTHANENEALADVAEKGLATVHEHLAMAESLRGEAVARSQEQSQASSQLGSEPFEEQGR